VSKKVEQTNFRVVIEPRGLGNFGQISMPDRLICPDKDHRLRQYRERCDEIAADVKRHVDNVGHVYVDFDTEGECEHCGSRWTEDSDQYNGGCCEKDQVAQDIRDAAKAKEQA
jgi:hypothetical protein